jgi:hypothetical protein
MRTSSCGAALGAQRRGGRWPLAKQGERQADDQHTAMRSRGVRVVSSRSQGSACHRLGRPASSLSPLRASAPSGHRHRSHPHGSRRVRAGVRCGRIRRPSFAYPTDMSAGSPATPPGTATIAATGPARASRWHPRAVGGSSLAVCVDAAVRLVLCPESATQPPRRCPVAIQH